eukprot:scaffold10375_cov49-Phaeocystis_antarctica.AAC.1
MAASTWSGYGVRVSVRVEDRVRKRPRRCRLLVRVRVKVRRRGSTLPPLSAEASMKETPFSSA